MAGGKQSPRDKMIGMMYLVLLALLAMNVTKSVLNSFVVINGAMTETNEVFSGKNAASMAEFNRQNTLNQAKVGPWLAKAKAVSAASKELDDYFEALKKHIIIKVEGYSEEQLADGDDWVTLDTAQALGDIDKPQTVLLGPDAHTPIDGEWTMNEMKSKISEWESKVIAQLPAEDKAKIDIHFTYENGVNNDGEIEEWHIAHFYHAPLAAVITDITMFQNMIKNRESEALAVLMKHITAAEFDFDEIAVKVIPNSNYVVLGDSFKADVIVAAYSSTQNPELEVGTSLDTAGKTMSDWAVKAPFDANRVDVKDGVAHYGYKPTSEGEVTWGGIMKVRKAGTDQYELYPFEHTFIAAKPSTVVSPTKMNVMYRGLKNPIDVSVAGFSASELVVTASGGSISGSNGKFEVVPNKTSKLVKINVAVKQSAGGTRSMGAPMEFRIKRVPDPIGKFAGVLGSGKPIPKAQMQRANKVTAEMVDFDFDGVSYKVTSFTMKGTKSGKPVTLKSTSASLTGQMKKFLKAVGSKSSVVIKNIQVQGPDGAKRYLKNPIVVDIQ
jgi:gliding motility-associated protein GldM